MAEGKKFKFRGSIYRVIKVLLDIILAVNEDKPFEDIRRFTNLKIIK